MLAVGLSYMAFIMFRYVLHNPSLLRVFIVNGAGFSQMLFLHLLIWSCDFYFSFCLCGELHCWFANVVPNLHSQNNSMWSWYMLFLMHCCIWFANIFLRVLVYVFIRDIGLQFSFFVVFLSGFGIRIMLALLNEFVSLSSCWILWVWEDVLVLFGMLGKIHLQSPLVKGICWEFFLILLQFH